LLPDYGGDYFNHVKSKLVQLDVRDKDNNLIGPWRYYEELKPGTLVLALVSLHCYNMIDEGGKERKERKVSIVQLDNCDLANRLKIYQMNAHTIRVLDRSDEVAEVRTRPIAPNSGERAVSALPKRTVPAAFDNFSLPAPNVVQSPASSSIGSSSTLGDVDAHMEDVAKTGTRGNGAAKQPKRPKAAHS
jgi:hypothetical protein